MPTEYFKASTQYGDLSGTVAADRADTESVLHWLSSQGLLQEGERLIGTKLFCAQSPATDEPYVLASFLLAPNEANLKVRIPGVEEPPTIVVRGIEREIPLASFMAFFKRLELTLSSGNEFEGRSYTITGK